MVPTMFFLGVGGWGGEVVLPLVCFSICPFDAVNVNQDGQIMLDEHILSCEVIDLTGATAAIILFCAIDQTGDGVVYTHEEVMANLFEYL